MPLSTSGAPLRAAATGLPPALAASASAFAATSARACRSVARSQPTTEPVAGSTCKANMKRQVVTVRLSKPAASPLLHLWLDPTVQRIGKHVASSCVCSQPAHCCTSAHQGTREVHRGQHRRLATTVACRGLPQPAAALKRHSGHNLAPSQQSTPHLPLCRQRPTAAQAGAHLRDAVRLPHVAPDEPLHPLQLVQPLDRLAAICK